MAPRYSVYGYDVIAQIGWAAADGAAAVWLRSTAGCDRPRADQRSEVRYLYHHQYLSLLACLERQRLARRCRRRRADADLLLSLDGLAPEGGEPQLWVVRELQTGLTLRSGWLSQQDQHDLQPTSCDRLPTRAGG